MVPGFGWFAIAFVMMHVGSQTSLSHLIADEPLVDFTTHDVTVPYLLEGMRKLPLDTLTQDGNHLSVATISFHAFGRNVVVHAVLNSGLMSSHYYEKHHENFDSVHSRPRNRSSHCFYQGVVKDVDHPSQVALSMCGGKLSGFVDDGNEVYYIEPAGQRREIGRHFVYRASDHLPSNFSCGNDHPSESDMASFLPSTPSDDSAHVRRKRNIVSLPSDSNVYSNFVELILVNDYRQFKAWGEDKEKVIQRSKEIANIVNMLYKQLNIFVALVGVEVWTDQDEIELSDDGDDTLTSFLNYRKQRLLHDNAHPNDNAQLITGMVFKDGVVGKAYKSLMCTYEYSAGVNMDHHRLITPVATTVAHEMGHNFGMEHDVDKCECPDNRCIMASASGSILSPKKWSSCSKQYLQRSVKRGVDACLKNRPKTLFDSPVCGNGFVEDGEQCDCGTLVQSECDNKCCDVAKCQLAANVTCGSGDCCDLQTCNLKPRASMCRPSVGRCDLAEFCSGESTRCPDDHKVHDGVSCDSSGDAYCYKGKCASRDSQCKRLWGPTGRNSDSRCYDQNIKANQNGNCGFSRITRLYTKCPRVDVMCGMLHCTHMNERLEYGMESVAYKARSYITIGSKLFPCHSALIDLGLDTPDPGMVPNGAACGTGKICVNQTCTTLSEIFSGCNHNCHDNGICNDRGNCHCFAGYAPPDCRTPGDGGSVNSGPMEDVTDRYSFLIAMLVIFLGIVPFFIVMAVVVCYHKGKLKKLWHGKQPTIVRKKPQALSLSPTKHSHSSGKSSSTSSRNNVNGVLKVVGPPVQPPLQPVRPAPPAPVTIKKKPNPDATRKIQHTSMNGTEIVSNSNAGVKRAPKSSTVTSVSASTKLPSAANHVNAVKKPTAIQPRLQPSQPIIPSQLTKQPNKPGVPKVPIPPPNTSKPTKVARSATSVVAQVHSTKRQVPSSVAPAVKRSQTTKSPGASFGIALKPVNTSKNNSPDNNIPLPPRPKVVPKMASKESEDIKLPPRPSLQRQPSLRPNCKPPDPPSHYYSPVATESPTSKPKKPPTLPKPKI